MKRQTLNDMRNMSKSMLIHLCKQFQEENLKLKKDKQVLLRAFQGYRLGISQLRDHIDRVLARTKDIEKMETGIEL